MAQAKILTVGGTNYEMIDDTARTNATTALNNAEYNRQGLIGKYPGQSLATLLAGEVSGSATIYDALHKRVQAANFSGMRVGDYIDVPLVSASKRGGPSSPCASCLRTSTRTTSAATAPRATTSRSSRQRPSPWPRPSPAWPTTAT